MSDAMKVEVYQGSYPYVGDGVQKFARGNRRGEVVVPDWFAQLAVEGRTFNVSNPTPGTAVAAGTTSYAATTPAFLIDVPSGYTIVPTHIQLKQGGTVAGGVIAILCQVDNKLRYSSGGTAQTIKARRTDAPYGSGCTAYSGGSAITAAAAGTGVFQFWQSLLSPDVSPSADVSFPGFDNCLDWTIRNYMPPVVVGPGSLLIHAYAGATAPSFHYSISWLEMSTSLLT